MKTFMLGVIACLLALNAYNAFGQAFEQATSSRGITAQSVDIGGGMRQYSFSNGVTGQRNNLGGGFRQYQYSDGETIQRYGTSPYRGNSFSGGKQWK